MLRPEQEYFKLSVFAIVKYQEILVFYHLFANRNQFDDEDRSSLSPENVATQLGFSKEEDFHGIKCENQRLETDQVSRQECGYAMLTTRTMMVK